MSHGWFRKLVFLISFTSAAYADSPPAPSSPKGNQVLHKSAITLSYNNQNKQADWVFYHMTPSQLQNCVQRGNNFQQDTNLDDSVAAKLSDYSRSGYDRGHLSPAGDNKWSQLAMDESFLLSNISPQRAEFNRGIWAKLEGLVRGWVSKYKDVWIVTGPNLNKEVGRIGSGQVTVSGSFYKAIVAKTKDGYEGIGFELPQDASGDLVSYAMPISDLENETKLNFYPGLEREDQVERQLDRNFWDFSAKANNSPCRSSASLFSEILPMNPDSVLH